MKEGGRLLKENAIAANKGNPLPHDLEALKTALHLDGTEPDGQTLKDRTLSSRSRFCATFFAERDSIALFMPIVRLESAVHRKSANESQEQMARQLVELATIQITREGDICPGASMTLLETAAHRPDLVSSALALQVLQAMAVEELEFIAGQLETKSPESSNEKP